MRVLITNNLKYTHKYVVYVPMKPLSTLRRHFNTTIFLGNQSEDYTSLIDKSRRTDIWIEMDTLYTNHNIYDYYVIIGFLVTYICYMLINKIEAESLTDYGRLWDEDIKAGCERDGGVFEWLGND